MTSVQPYEYTINMKTIFDEKLSELKSFYCREDFELSLSDVDRAPADAIKHRMTDLEKLCEARGIDAEKLILDRTLLDKIPTREQMQENLLQAFYDMYSEFPKTTDFMERIVRRLAPEYNNDTVRTAILKKFLVGAGKKFKRFNTKNIMEWGEKRLSRSERNLLSSLKEEQRRDLIISKIDDSIFIHKKIELSDAEIIQLIASRLEKYKEDENLAFEQLELSSMSLATVDEFLDKYKLNESELSDSEKVLRIAAALKNGTISEDSLSQNHALTKGVENDFTAQLKKIPRTKKTGEIGNAAELYTQTKKDRLKTIKAAAKKRELDYELLDMCSDLAAGNFRVNGKTKVYLYYFAFMFKMTVPLMGKKEDEKTDFAKNMFQDYYNDNLLRALEGNDDDSVTSDDVEKKQKAASDIEKEPTGEGINFKNFVEAIYIYFLCRDDLKLTPGEKIDRAEAVINECVELAKKSKASKNKSSSEHTCVYRDHHMNVLLNKSIEELTEYVADKYTIISPDNAGASRIMAASEENTAYDLIGTIMDDLDAEYPDVELFDVRHMKKIPKDIKDDIVCSADSGFDWKLPKLLRERFPDDAGFMKIVSELDKRVHAKNGRFNKTERIRMITLLRVLALCSKETAPISMYIIQSRMEDNGIVSVGLQLNNALNALGNIGYDIQKIGKNYFLGKRNYDDDELNMLLKRVSGSRFVIGEDMDLMMAELLIRRLKSDKRVKRSELISIHLNYYIALLDYTEALDAFPDVFEDYAYTINPILEEARYQPLSTKNLFDMYVVTELFFYLVENNIYT